MKNEINEIPYRAELCYSKNKGIILPENVPYLGMGSSYNSTCVFRYLGINIFAEQAADYFNYLLKNRESENGVLISQSGESSETLWCADHFKSFLAIVNDTKSLLGRHNKCKKAIDIYSGQEDQIPSKTYINSLLVQYMGFGFDPWPAVKAFKNELSFFEDQGLKLGEIMSKRIRWWRKRSIYIIGSGPNIATANQAALVLSEIIKAPIVSMSVAQYDHGHKETARKSLVIALNHEGPDYERTKKLLRTIRNAGGRTIEYNRPMVESIFSPLTFSIPFFYAADYLAEKMRIESPFQIGKKITRVKKDQ